jgi:hypothetical protein
MKNKRQPTRVFIGKTRKNGTVHIKLDRAVLHGCRMLSVSQESQVQPIYSIGSYSAVEMVPSAVRSKLTFSTEGGALVTVEGNLDLKWRR